MSVCREVWRFVQFKKFILAQRSGAKAKQYILKQRRGKQGETEQSNVK